MIRLRVFIVFIVGLISCNKNKIHEYPLEITKSDTTILNKGNFKFIGTSYEISDKENYLIIHQGREIFWFDIKKDSIVKSVNLDTTDLLLPNGRLQHVRVIEENNSLLLFFPDQNKIIELGKDLEIKKELDLKGVKESGFILMPYGRAFFYNELNNQYAIGMISDQFNDLEKFVKATRFIGVFDGETGELKNSFGKFEADNSTSSSIQNNLGLINVGEFDSKIFLRETVGSPIIRKFDFSGNELGLYQIGTEFLSYEIDENNGGFEEDHVFEDHNYDMVIADSDRVVSIGVKFKDEKNNILRDYGILFVEDLENEKCYSLPIFPFQKLIWANNSKIYLVRNHPVLDEMILVKLEYQLEET